MQMQKAGHGQMGVHSHRHEVHPPWLLLQTVLRDRARDLRLAAHIQLQAREPVIWHPDLVPSLDMQKTCLSLSSRYSPVGRPPGIERSEPEAVQQLNAD